MLEVITQDNFIYYVMAKNKTAPYVAYIPTYEFAQWCEVYELEKMMAQPHLDCGDCYLWSKHDMPEKKYFHIVDVVDCIKKGEDFKYE